MTNTLENNTKVLGFLTLKPIDGVVVRVQQSLALIMSFPATAGKETLFHFIGLRSLPAQCELLESVY